MTEIKLQLTVDEANLILEALGQMPFARVYSLVGKIQEQASRQVEEAGAQPGPALVQAPGEVAVDGE